MDPLLPSKGPIKGSAKMALGRIKIKIGKSRNRGSHWLLLWVCLLLIFSERSLGGAMLFSRVAPRFVRFGRRFSAVPMVSLTQHSAPLPKETFSLLGTDGTGWRRRDGVAARAPGLGLW
jgi:hypothetical protein